MCTSLLGELALVWGYFWSDTELFYLEEGIFLPKSMPSSHRNFLKVMVANT